MEIPHSPESERSYVFRHERYSYDGTGLLVADSANGYAAYTLAPPGTDVLAVEFKINLLAPAQGEGFLACGRVLRAGRRLTVCQADVFNTWTTERTLIATMLSTIIVRPTGRDGGDAT